MAASPGSKVVYRNRAWRWNHVAASLVVVVWVAMLVWGLEGHASTPVRAALLAGVLALVLLLSRNLDPSVTFSPEGLQRGKRFWPWAELSTVQPEQHPRWPGTGPIGGLTLYFGDTPVRFDTSWPLGQLLKEVFTRAPLKAPLQRALDRKEREHGLDFGPLWLGPHALELRKEGKPQRTVALRDVHDVVLKLSDRPLFRVGEGPDALQVRLTDVRDPHVLAALLLRQGASRHEAPRLPRIEGPPPPEAMTREAAITGVVLGLMCIGAGIGTGGIPAWHFIEKEWRITQADRDYWRPVPAEITASRTWQVPDTEFRQGALTFRFVVDGTEHEGTRFSPAGTRAEEAERFQPGQQVTAYVPRGQPEQAVLYRSNGDSRLFFALRMFLPLAVLSFLTVAGLNLLAGNFSWEEPREKRPGT